MGFRRTTLRRYRLTIRAADTVVQEFDDTNEARAKSKFIQAAMETVTWNSGYVRLERLDPTGPVLLAHYWISPGSAPREADTPRLH